MKLKRLLIDIAVSLFAVLLVLFCPTAAFAAADTQAPTAPGDLTVTGKTHTSITLSWSASHDNIKVKGYQIFRDGRKVGTSAKNTYNSCNLTPGTQYDFSVRAYDTAGNVSDSSPSIKASTAEDTQAPDAPGNLKASGVTYTSAVLSWRQSDDNVGIKGYEVYVNGEKAASTTKTVYEYKKLTPGMSYTFHVKAIDKAGNYSAPSKAIPVDTPQDKTAPLAPTELKATSVSVSEISLTWSPASDNVAVKGYDIIRDGIKIGTTSKTSYNSRGLFPGMTYSYTVRASDISGNQSAISRSLTITTSRDSQAPSAPSELKVTAAKGSSITLNWTAAKDNGKVAGYQIYCNDIVIGTSVSASKVLKIPFCPGQHKLCVKAFDQSGNLSDCSNAVTVVTTFE